MMRTIVVQGRLSFAALRLLGACVILLLHAASAAEGGEPIHLSAVIHVHSIFSSGSFTLEQLVEKAGEKGINILMVTDHDRVAMEYGLPLFRNLLKWTVERPSVLKQGAESYLTEIARLNASQAAVLVIPGVQSSPFYHWSGSPLNGSLTAHNYQKELLLIGMGRAEDYRELPLLHNGFATSALPTKLSAFAALAAVGGIGFCLFFFSAGRLKWGGLLIGVIGTLAAADQHPFRSSRFDPYHGDQGIAPFQEVIDYTRRRGGLVFWCHPESNYAAQGLTMGPITLVTGHYAEDLAKSKGYTGFAALYGDTSTITEPGGLWDHILNRYCRGERAEPVWGIAEADFHDEQAGGAIDLFQTVILAHDKTAAAVLNALGRGRCYAVQKGGGYRLILDRFEVRNPQSGGAAASGGEVFLHGPAVVSVRISASDQRLHRVKVVIVRGGTALSSIEGITPMVIDLADDANWMGRCFYRIEAQGDGDSRLLSNPIFVNRVL
jgi:hypothetical protein